MIRRRLSAFLRALADRLDPREPEPEVMSYSDFVESLRRERDREEFYRREADFPHEFRFRLRRVK